MKHDEPSYRTSGEILTAEEEIESVFARIGEVQQVSLDLEMLTGHVNYIIVIVIVVYIPALYKGVPNGSVSGCQFTIP